MKNLITFDITKETFNECVADRQMHLARGAVDPELMNWSDIDSALYYSDIAPPFMHLYKNGVVPPEKYIEELKSGSRTIQRLNTQAVQSLLEAGSTAILNRIDVRQELIRKLCEEVASFTDADTTANAYLAFSGEGSFGAHWDTHDVMAIQLIGKKHWRIYPPTYQFPLPGHTSKSFEAACPAEPIFDGMLEAGDLLYLPRGWWHEVLPVGETLHIAVGIYPPNILNYLAWFLEKNLRNHEELRRSLRPDAVTTDIISRACQVLTDQLNNPEVFSNFMDEISVKRIKPRIPFSLNSLSSLDKPLEPHPIPSNPMSTTFYRIPLLITYIFFCFFLQGCAFYSEKNKEDLNISNKNWSDTAVQDIKRIHEILSETHPAKLDTSNHEFNNWLDFVGYKESMLLAERSESEQQAFSALKFYLTGFMDEHLSVGTYADQKDPLSWAGWHMEHSNGRYLVASRAIDWSVDLPQIGDEVISCDSISIHEILHNKVAPFVDRRIHLENTLNKLARYITIEQANSPLWETLRPTKCLFQKLSGKYQEIPLIWKKQPKNLKIKRPPPPPQGMHQIKKGIYWIHASNFKLNTEEHIDFDHFLNNIQSIDNADAIILDTRGNNGGNSMVGSAILSAALKKSAPSYQNSKAYWRISPISMATIDGHRESALKIEGKDSQIYKWLNDLRESMEVATQRGENFVEQADITSEDDTEIPQGWPPFQGKLILITDSYCFSACLDFVDEVMSVPGALHVGSTTDADTRYMDIGSAVLPSGLKIWIPLKVWVGRRRQDNVPYIPQIKYHQDINDTKALQAWVLQSILLVAKNIGTP